MNVIIVGSGAHGRIVAEALILAGGYHIVGFADDDPAKLGKELPGGRVLGPWQEFSAEGWIVAVGKNEARKHLFDQLLHSGHNLIKVIHPRSFVSPQAQVGPGSVILAGAVVSAGTRLDGNVIVNIGAVIDHDAHIGEHAHVGPGAIVGSYGVVEPLEFLTPGSTRLRSK